MFAAVDSNTNDFTTLPASEQQGPNCQMRLLAVMFTDMAGSSQFAEKFGARAALQKRKRHNALLLPLIDTHRGQLVEIVGDALMVIFEETADAARCAIAMQQRLAAYNQSHDVDVDDLEIHIRAGIHTGKLVAYHNGKHLEVAGRAVNVAARVEAANRKQTDQILISDAAFTELQKNTGFQTVPLATIKPKGIGKLQIHQLLWDVESSTGEAAAEHQPPSVVATPAPVTTTAMTTRPVVLSASSTTVEREAPPQSAAPAAVRACHSLFLDVANQQGHVLPVWVRVQAGQPHSIQTRIDCDEAMRESARNAIHSAFELVQQSGFTDIQLEEHAVEWWVGKQEIQYEGASLGLAVALATIAALTGLPVDPRTAVTGEIDNGQAVAVTGVSKKWESLRSLGSFSRLIVPPANLADLPPDAWIDPKLKITAVPTLEAAVAEIFGGVDSTRLSQGGCDTVDPTV